jgi:hypothetical protein
MKSIRSLPALIVALMMAGEPLNGQIQINSNVTPVDMVESIVGVGIVYDNITFQGASVSRGIFSNGQITNLGFDDGIYLTSGSGAVIPGPNVSPNASVNNGTPGNALLNSITTGTTYDASVLEFDFIPVMDTLRFSYVFGSEEYSEHVGFSYNDVFGYFITGPNPQGGYYTNKNLAIVPGTANTSVNVNNVNNGYAPPGIVPGGPGTNNEYYADNTGGLTLEYDGFTTVLTAWLLVVPFNEYHLLIGIADVGNGFTDSGIFIEENSFSSPGRDIAVYTILYPPGLTENMVEGHVEADLVFKLPPYWAPWTIFYTIGGTAINGVDYEYIDNSLYFEYGVDSAILHITPVLDGVIEGDETIVLTVINNLFGLTTYETREFTIQDYVNMNTAISPNTTTCSGDTMELWVNVTNGIPPYSFEWQPGAFTNDTILVSPEMTTTYTVNYHDQIMVGGTLSTIVAVLPDNLNDILFFSFGQENNPGLPEDAIGEITGDTVFVVVPEGAAIVNLIATFAISSCALAYVNGTEQESEVTANDFSNPVIYEVTALNGDVKEWTVVVDIETGINKNLLNSLSISPNPSSGMFYLEYSYSLSVPVELAVMDLTGRKVYENKGTTIERFEINLSSQARGMYFLQIKSGDRMTNRKLIIQ